MSLDQAAARIQCGNTVVDPQRNFSKNRVRRAGEYEYYNDSIRSFVRKYAFDVHTRRDKNQVRLTKLTIKL